MANDRTERRERALMLRAWGERPNDVFRAAITDVETEERRTAVSVDAMHRVIDDFLTEARILEPSTEPAPSEGNGPR